MVNKNLPHQYIVLKYIYFKNNYLNVKVVQFKGVKKFGNMPNKITINKPLMQFNRIYLKIKYI